MEHKGPKEYTVGELIDILKNENPNKKIAILNSSNTFSHQEKKYGIVTDLTKSIIIKENHNTNENEEIFILAQFFTENENLICLPRFKEIENVLKDVLK